MELVKVTLENDYKGGKIQVTDTLPHFSDNEDYFKQYHTIWRVLHQRVIEMKAQSVLEFGTREGYSTQIFSKALKETKGSIVTVDKDIPKEAEKLEALGNVYCEKHKVEEHRLHCPVDILYIDDWHNPWHLYYELNTFAHMAKVVMIHDVCLEAGNHRSLLRSIESWCISNMIIWSIYPMNQCGLAVLEIEKSNNYFQERKEL